MASENVDMIEKAHSDGKLMAFSPRVRERLQETEMPIVVTGAGGWLGLATIEMLYDALGNNFRGRVHAFGRHSRLERLRNGFEFPIDEMAHLDGLACKSRILLAHYAFLTREKTAYMNVEDYAAANRLITKTVLDASVRLGAVGLFTISSGAVYDAGRTVTSDLAANPYGYLKAEEERSFLTFAQVNRTRLSLCRLFNLAGPYLNKSYVLGDLVDATLAGRPLMLRAAKSVYRSYSHVRDIIDIGFAGMFGIIETKDVPYDTAGELVVEVGELADRVRSILGRPDLPIERPEVSSTIKDYYAGDRERFSALAEALGIELVGLNRQIEDTATYRSWLSKITFS